MLSACGNRARHAASGCSRLGCLININLLIFIYVCHGGACHRRFFQGAATLLGSWPAAVPLIPVTPASSGGASAMATGTPPPTLSTSGADDGVQVLARMLAEGEGATAQPADSSLAAFATGVGWSPQTSTTTSFSSPTEFRQSLAVCCTGFGVGSTSTCRNYSLLLTRPTFRKLWGDSPPGFPSCLVLKSCVVVVDQ